MPLERIARVRRDAAFVLAARGGVPGLPACWVPCGFSTGGLSIGLQLVGRPFEDATVLRAAHAYEQQAGWITRHPAL